MSSYSDRVLDGLIEAIDKSEEKIKSIEDRIENGRRIYKQLKNIDSDVAKRDLASLSLLAYESGRHLLNGGKEVVKEGAKERLNGFNPLS